MPLKNFNLQGSPFEFHEFTRDRFHRGETTPISFRIRRAPRQCIAALPTPRGGSLRRIGRRRRNTRPACPGRMPSRSLSVRKRAGASFSAVGGSRKGGFLAAARTHAAKFSSSAFDESRRMMLQTLMPSSNPCASFLPRGSCNRLFNAALACSAVSGTDPHSGHFIGL